ncbi:MAG: hypothetical protein JW768_16640 [Chitinispirillaceae bacterium]|nr:hypothetical protein [Chitinispirillaceae bacterium]
MSQRAVAPDLCWAFRRSTSAGATDGECPSAGVGAQGCAETTAERPKARSWMRRVNEARHSPAVAGEWDAQIFLLY